MSISRSQELEELLQIAVSKFRETGFELQNLGKNWLLDDRPS